MERQLDTSISHGFPATAPELVATLQDATQLGGFVSSLRPLLAAAGMAELVRVVVLRAEMSRRPHLLLSACDYSLDASYMLELGSPPLSLLAAVVEGEPALAWAVIDVVARADHAHAGPPFIASLTLLQALASRRVALTPLFVSISAHLLEYVREEIRTSEQQYVTEDLVAAFEALGFAAGIAGASLLADFISQLDSLAEDECGWQTDLELPATFVLTHGLLRGWEAGADQSESAGGDVRATVGDALRALACHHTAFVEVASRAPVRPRFDFPQCAIS